MNVPPLQTAACKEAYLCNAGLTQFVMKYFLTKSGYSLTARSISRKTTPFSAKSFFRL